jgi:hypothetical protein
LESLDAQNIDVGGQTEKRAPKELSGKKFTWRVFG